MALTVGSISPKIQGLHVILARIAKSQIWEIDKVESDMIAADIINILSLYDIKLDPRTVAITSLITTLGAVYGTRIAAWQIESAMKKKTPQGVDNVVQFTGWPN